MLAALWLVASAPARGQMLYVASGQNSVADYTTAGAILNNSFITGLDNSFGIILSGNRLYVLNFGSGTLGIYSPLTGSAIEPSFITGLSSPIAMAVANGFIYIASPGRGTVAEYQASTGSLVNSTFLSKLGGPSGLAVLGNVLYVANSSSGTVGAYDAGTGEVLSIDFIDGLKVPSALLISGNVLYVASEGDGRVGAYDAATGSAINASFITGLDLPSGLAIRGNDLYVVSNGSGKVGLYNANTGASIADSLITGLSHNAYGIAVTQAPPVITSGTDVSGTAGFPFQYQITASNSPTSYSATGLPSALSLNQTTGFISGAIQSTGTFSPSISAINSSGTGSAILNIAVATPPPPVISGTTSVTGTAGFPFAFHVIASNYPSSFAASGLAPGLAINGTTGLISGTPTTLGTFAGSVTASNLGGTGTGSLAFTINTPPPPIIGGTLKVTGFENVPFTYHIQARNFPASYAATGLPPGLGLDPSTGVISGTPSSDGTFPVSISAINLGGTGSAILTIGVRFDFPKVAGDYRGACSLGGTDVGLFTLSLSRAGQFTGRLTLAVVRYSLAGKFADDGTLQESFESHGATVTEDLSVDLATARISGAITIATSAGTNTYSVDSTLLGSFNSRSLPHGLAGRYTLQFPAISGTDPSLPHAPGFGIMTVSTSGAVTFSGGLPDGTGFTAASRLDAGGTTAALFIPLYGAKNRGSLAGILTFETMPGSDADGILQWIKPMTSDTSFSGPFSTPLTLLAAHYAHPPLVSGSASISIQGADILSPGISDTLSISSSGKVSVSGSNGGSVSLTLDSANGEFTGAFIDPATSAMKSHFRGAVFQKPSDSGFGFFISSGRSGSVTLGQ